MFSLATIFISLEAFGLIYCIISIISLTLYLQYKQSNASISTLVLLFSNVGLMLFVNAIGLLLRTEQIKGSETLITVSNILQIFLSFSFICIFITLAFSDFTTDGGINKSRRSRFKIVLFSTSAFFAIGFSIIYLIFPGYPKEIHVYISIARLLVLFASFIYVLLHTKVKSIIVLCATLPALSLLALVLELFFYGFEYFNAVAFINVILYTLFFYSILTDRYMVAQENLFEEKKSLEESKAKLMMSQINPHFIFNALTSIAQLCEVDPKLAKETTITFSKYLRENMNSLTSTELIPFDDELKHVENYVKIEKARFKDRVNIEYDVKYNEFSLPPLSLQPLVENAIKHGICNKIEGGTVTLHTDKKDNLITIIVSDDGAGFDKETTTFDGNHVGVSNIMSRLKDKLNANVDIESEIGKGTIVTITFEEKANENINS